MNGPPFIICNEPAPPSERRICSLMKPISSELAALWSQRRLSIVASSEEFKHLHNVLERNSAQGPDPECRAWLPHPAARQNHPRQCTWVTLPALRKESGQVLVGEQNLGACDPEAGEINLTLSWLSRRTSGVPRAFTLTVGSHGLHGHWCLGARRSLGFDRWRAGPGRASRHPSPAPAQSTED